MAMGFDFSVFKGNGGRLDEAYVSWLVQEQAVEANLYYAKLWSYYRNECLETGVRQQAGLAGGENRRPYRQAQEYGLPSRITGMRSSFYGGILGGSEAEGIQRKEVVIENDIAWRIDGMVDFLFGKPVLISSSAKEAERAGQIQGILQAVLEANGGASYLQELALLGSVYGFVDVIVRMGEEVFGVSDSAGAGPKTFAEVLEAAKHIMLEAIEAPRSLPILDEDNYKKIRYYVQHFRQQHNELGSGEDGVQAENYRGQRIGRQKESHNVEVIGAEWWQRYRDGRLVGEGRNRLGAVPVVHIQNMPLPGHYEGQSDVEPLIPLQDELNTRLSDRANRVTFQSFKMYLAKGIDGFEDRVVGPGRLWSTENPEASIEEFGGDDGSEGELAHIKEIREAMDKTSGVSSAAAGIIKGRLGNLTSAVALKITMMGMLAKTERKRQSYGKGIAEICRLVLRGLDASGIFPTRPEEREIEIYWPSPLPENAMERLEEASLKVQLGVAKETVLKELGY